MLKLVYSNLFQRPTRTGVSILAVSLGVVLVLVSVGLSYGQLSDAADRMRRIGGDFMLQPPNSTFFFALDSGTLPVRLTEVIAKIEGVQAVTPVLAKFIGDKFHLVYGIDKDSFGRVNDSLRFTEGRHFESPYEAIIDTNYARSKQLKVGDRLDLLNHTFTVVGIYQEGTASRVMIPLATLQELNGTPDKVTTFFIRGGDEALLDTVYERLKERFRDYKITRTADLQEIMAANTPVFKQFLAAVVFLSVAISFLIVLLAMYTTITERTREIGVLKSLGASKSFIVQLILRESLLICSAGVVLGFVLAAIAIKLILTAFPSMPVNITATWRIAAAAIALFGGVLGALYPALKAAQLDPVKALGYE
ncbi:MAG TPA: ABC transporter permease [Acidobacteriota bacterium]|nr:ABC transporter permease [Acidobacteriota bacterium]